MHWVQESNADGRAVAGAIVCFVLDRIFFLLVGDTCGTRQSKLILLLGRHIPVNTKLRKSSLRAPVAQQHHREPGMGMLRDSTKISRGPRGPRIRGPRGPQEGGGGGEFYKDFPWPTRATDPWATWPTDPMDQARILQRFLGTFSSEKLF